MGWVTQHCTFDKTMAHTVMDEVHFENKLCTLLPIMLLQCYVARSKSLL